MSSPSGSLVNVLGPSCRFSMISSVSLISRNSLWVSNAGIFAYRAPFPFFAFSRDDRRLFTASGSASGPARSDLAQGG